MRNSIRKTFLILPALSLTALPAAAPAGGLDGGTQHSVTRPDSEAGGNSYGNRNRGGPYGFYSYPSHRHIDGGGLDRSPPFTGSAGTSPYDNSHGSAYYGRDYGAPYFGGGYYDQGTYYRERRD